MPQVIPLFRATLNLQQIAILKRRLQWKTSA